MTSHAPPAGLLGYIMSAGLCTDARLMDWILQKEASRRRRKQAAVTARQKASSSATTNVDDSSDPTAAAAALRAFGAVVELCTTAACRRRRLLQHFGEVPQAQQQQQDQQQRCCDFCDSAADVEAAVEQLQRAGELMLQRRFSKNTGVGRKRHHTGVDEWGNTGSSLSDEGLSSPLSSGKMIAPVMHA